MTETKYSTFYFDNNLVDISFTITFAVPKNKGQ